MTCSVALFFFYYNLFKLMKRSDCIFTNAYCMLAQYSEHSATHRSENHFKVTILCLFLAGKEWLQFPFCPTPAASQASFHIHIDWSLAGKPGLCRGSFCPWAKVHYLMRLCQEELWDQVDTNLMLALVQVRSGKTLTLRLRTVKEASAFNGPASVAWTVWCCISAIHMHHTV